jgi:hypothetical protein
VADLAPIAGKLANLIRRLGSDRDGEVVATARALIRTLEGAGSDLHELAERIENSGESALTDAEMQKIFDAGAAAGRKQAKQKARRQRCGVPERKRNGTVVSGVSRSVE